MMKRLLFLFFFILIFSCAPKEKIRINKLSVSEVRKIEAKFKREHLASLANLKKALTFQKEFLLGQDLKQLVLSIGNFSLTYQDLLDTVVLLQEKLDVIYDHPDVLSNFFDIYVLSKDALLTGYYEPWLEASYKKEGEYIYPIYKLPSDLEVLDLGNFHPRFKGERIYYRLEKNKVLPYFSRKEIESGALAGKNLEIAWVKDRIKLFFLHIQGSGRLIFPDGTVKHVLYAGKNGHQYVSIGKVLIEKGYLLPEEVTMQSIYSFLQRNPYLLDEILYANPSYVFFKLADEGPFGAINQPLTPWVSVASDNQFAPWGSVLIMEGFLPGIVADKSFVSFFAVQDTGGAIRGEHLDLFCGSGWEAELVAGRLKNKVKVYLLVRKKND